MMVVSGLPTFPPVFRVLVRVVGIGRAAPDVAAKVNLLGYRTLLVGWAVMPIMWAFWGASYWATLRAMGVPWFDPAVELPLYTATVTLATVAGFLVVVLPGGAVVREAALAELVIPHLSRLLVVNPQLMAWASAILLRLVWLVAEVIVSAILYPIKANRGPC